ncbi:hypothetical protein [Burkholderia ubonensis]|uniref:hypothetical protein n=1 Tax=Burkholderia ubonensis TaxID=101571 RepID=UPI000B32E1EB|nr:hypothetical protein [Burkholderia ubonensis]
MSTIHASHQQPVYAQDSYDAEMNQGGAARSQSPSPFTRGGPNRQAFRFNNSERTQKLQDLDKASAEKNAENRDLTQLNSKASQKPPAAAHGALTSHEVPSAKGDANVAVAKNEYAPTPATPGNSNAPSPSQYTLNIFLRKPSQSAIDSAQNAGLNTQDAEADPQDRIFVNLEKLNRPTGFDESELQFTDAPAVSIGQAALPDQADRLDATTPVFFISPSPLSADSPEDCFIQGKIGEEQLPEEVRLDENKMTALRDIRNRFNSEYVVKGSMTYTSSGGLADQHNYLDEKSVSIERVNPLRPTVNKPPVGSYILTKFTLGGNLTYSGEERTLYGYSKVTGSGEATAPVNSGSDGREYNFYNPGQSFVNNAAQTISVSPRDGGSSVNVKTASDVNSHTQETQSTVNVGVSIEGQMQTPKGGGGASGSFSYSRTDSEKNTASREDTRRDQNANEQSRVYSPINVAQGKGYNKTDYYTGILAKAGLTDVRVSFPSDALLDELIDQNSSGGNYIYDLPSGVGAKGGNREFNGHSDRYLKKDGTGLTWSSESITETKIMSSTGGNDVLVPYFRPDVSSSTILSDTTLDDSGHGDRQDR